MIYFDTLLSQRSGIAWTTLMSMAIDGNMPTCSVYTWYTPQQVATLLKGALS